MSAQRINVLIEAAMYGDEELPPANSRFSWTPPQSKLNVRGSHFPGKPHEVPMRDNSDRVGKHSISDLVPSGETATADDLIDFYKRIQSTTNPEDRQAMQREFDAHKREFESKATKIVDILLG